MSTQQPRFDSWQDQDFLNSFMGLGVCSLCMFCPVLSLVMALTFC